MRGKGEKEVLKLEERRRGGRMRFLEERIVEAAVDDDAIAVLVVAFWLGKAK